MVLVPDNLTTLSLLIKVRCWRICMCYFCSTFRCTCLSRNLLIFPTIWCLAAVVLDHVLCT